MPYISVVTPVYNAVNIVEELHHRLVEHLEAITDDFEIIMVNDACPYGSGEKNSGDSCKGSPCKIHGTGT